MPKLVRQVHTSPATGIFAPVFWERYRKEVHFLVYRTTYRQDLGTFSLDDASYAAYLEGKLWINWGSRRNKTAQQDRPSKPFFPVNVTSEAVRLRDVAAKSDVIAFLQTNFPGRQISVPYRERMSQLTIDEMNLSVRSSNALMRANARTFGRVKEIIQMEDGLKKIRNLGIKSEREIIRNFFSACYYQLSPAEQAVFWQKILDDTR